MRISDWSSDVCSSDLGGVNHGPRLARVGPPLHFVSRHGADRRTAAKRGNGPPLPLRPRSEFEADLDTVGRGLAGQPPHGIVELRVVGPDSGLGPILADNLDAPFLARHLEHDTQA